MRIYPWADGEPWSHVENYETKYWKSACQRNAAWFTFRVSKSCGEKVCLAKVSIFILTSKWERSKFRSHGQPSCQCSAMFFIAVSQHSLQTSCPNPTGSRANRSSATEKNSYNNWLPSSRSPSITETFLWMFVGSGEMLSQGSWVSFPAICPVRHRGFPPNFFHLFLLYTPSSNCRFSGLSFHSLSHGSSLHHGSWPNLLPLLVPFFFLTPNILAIIRQLKASVESPCLTELALFTACLDSSRLCFTLV